MLKKDKSIYIFLIPSFLLFLIFVVIPLFSGISISFSNWNGYSQEFDYIGIENFKNLIKSDLFKIAMTNTLIYGIFCTLIQNLLGLVYAVFLNQKFSMSYLVRLLVYLPSIVSGIVMGYMLYGVFSYNNGALNDVVNLFGIENVNWLANGKTAVLIIVLVNSIQFCGISMMIYLAGLQNIPIQLIEASELDGCSKIQTFYHVKLPLLMPAISTSFLVNLVGGFKLFSIIFALTNGGPGIATQSMGTAINYLHFSNENAGEAAAYGLILFLLIFVVSLSMNKYFSSKEVKL